MKKLILLIGVCAVCGLAHASPPQEWLDELVACREIADPAERVACYDPLVSRLAGELAAADVAPELAPLDSPPEVVERRPEVAPEAEPSAPETPGWAQAPAPAPEREADAPRSFDGVIVRIVRLNSGRYLFFTEDGAIWEQTQDVRVNLPSSLPARVEFRRRLTGNPMISFEGTRAGYRVRRIQ